MRPSVLLAALAALCGAALSSAVAAAAPEDPGPDAVTKSTYDVPVGGAVKLTTDVYLPGSRTRAPMVVLRHGYLRDRTNLAGWGQHLGSHGFVTVVFDSRDNLNDDPETDGADMASVVGWMLASSADASSPLHDRVDPARLAVGGHSAGGAAAVVAGAGLSPLSALVLLDSEDTAPSLAAAPSIHAPTIGLFGAPSTCNENGDNRKTYAAVGGPRLGIYVTGASHCDAEDPLDTACGFACGSTDDARHAEFKRYTTAFLEAYLQCDPSAYTYVGGAAATSDTAISILPATSGLVLPPPGCGADGGVADAGTPSGDDAGSGVADDAGSAGAGDAGGNGAAPGDASGDDGGCACHAAPGAPGEGSSWLVFALGALAFTARRRAATRSGR